jgi:hypothetical protein
VPVFTLGLGPMWVALFNSENPTVSPPRLSL